MGMYTEFKIDCKLKKETPEEVINHIEQLLSRNKLNYARNPIYGFSFVKKDSYHLCGSKDVKNYWGSIEQFIEYIEDHVAEGFGSKYEFTETITTYGGIKDEIISHEAGWFASKQFEDFDHPTFYYPLGKE